MNYYMNYYEYELLYFRYSRTIYYFIVVCILAHMVLIQLPLDYAILSENSSGAIDEQQKIKHYKK